MTDAYINGFCKKAEEMGVDPEELLKVAQLVNSGLARPLMRFATNPRKAWNDAKTSLKQVPQDLARTGRMLGNAGKAAWNAAKNTPPQKIIPGSFLLNGAATSGAAIRNAGRAAASSFYRDRTGGRSLGADLRGAGNAFTSGFKRNFTPGLGMIDRGLAGGVQGVKNYFTGK